MSEDSQIVELLKDRGLETCFAKNNIEKLAEWGSKI